MPELMTTADRIRTRLTVLGWTHERLADILGCPRGTLAQYLTGRRAILEGSRGAVSLEALARHLQVPLESLREDGDPGPLVILPEKAARP